MTLRLPPRYFTTPTRARFRKHRLPPELWETWELVNALAWLNEYRYTPPVSLYDLARILAIKVDAVRDRLARLVHYGWLKIVHHSGKASVYTPLVPVDTPDSCGTAVPSSTATPSIAAAPSTAASLIPPDAGEDSSESLRGTPLHCAGFSSPREPQRGAALPPEPSARDDSPSDYRGPNNVALAVARVDETNPDQPTTTSITRTHEEIFRIEDALADLGIETDEACSELLALPHVTPEYVEDCAHRKRCDATRRALEYRASGSRLGGGYYRQQIRAHRKPTYQMTRRERAEYRSRNDNHWEMDQLDRALDDAGQHM